MFVGESVLAEEVPVVCDEKKTPRSPVDLGVPGVPSKAALFLSLPNLAKARQASEALGDVCLNIVIEEDEWRLLGFSRLPSRHRLGHVSA